MSMNNDDVRSEAVRRLKAKKSFWQLAGSFVIVFVFLTGIWWFSGRGYFWPAWAAIGMGIALAYSGMNAYGPGKGITESQVQDEMRKIEGE